MPNENTVYLTGHLTRKPETKYSPSGTAYCRFSLATNSGKDENKKAHFHDLIAFGDTALLLDGLDKGAALSVRGALEYDEYEKDGVKRKSAIIKVWSMSLPLYKKRDASQPPRQTQQQPVTEDSDLPF